jgi:glycosyltransferase involved in cell wall biosynthesis
VAKLEVPERLAAADIFLNTTDVDNTPVSVIEAMACGLCIVSTDVGGIPYLLRDGYNALLVRPDDAAGMAKAVRRILRDPELSASLSVNARRTAEQFDWSVTLPKWDHLLRAAAERTVQ